MKFVISGCSGGGKSTLVKLMSAKGYTVFPEPGRQIVKEQSDSGGDALPWQNPDKFAIACVSRSLEFYREAERTELPSLFDRSYIDALSALAHLGSTDMSKYKDLPDQFPFADTVYFAAPWREIFINDAERRHSFEESVAEYHRLLSSYTDLGYRIVELPKDSPAARASFLHADIVRLCDLRR